MTVVHVSGWEGGCVAVDTEGRVHIVDSRETRTLRVGRASTTCADLLYPLLLLGTSTSSLTCVDLSADSSSPWPSPGPPVLNIAWSSPRSAFVAHTRGLFSQFSGRALVGRYDLGYTAAVANAFRVVEGRGVLVGDTRGRLHFFRSQGDGVLGELRPTASCASGVESRAPTSTINAHGREKVLSLHHALEGARLRVSTGGADGGVCECELWADGRLVKMYWRNTPLSRVTDLGFGRGREYAGGWEGSTYYVYELRSGLRAVKVDGGGWKRPNFIEVRAATTSLLV